MSSEYAAGKAEDTIILIKKCTKARMVIHLFFYLTIHKFGTKIQNINAMMWTSRR